MGLNGVDDAGCTAVIASAAWGHVEVLEGLLRARGDANARDGRGYTALHHAAVGGYLSCVELLTRSSVILGAITVPSLCFTVTAPPQYYHCAVTAPRSM